MNFVKFLRILFFKTPRTAPVVFPKLAKKIINHLEQTMRSKQIQSPFKGQR